MARVRLKASSGLRELAVWLAQEPTEQKGWRAHLCSVSKSVKGTVPLKPLPDPAKNQKFRLGIFGFSDSQEQRIILEKIWAVTKTLHAKG